MKKQNGKGKRKNRDRQKQKINIYELNWLNFALLKRGNNWRRLGNANSSKRRVG